MFGLFSKREHLNFISFSSSVSSGCQSSLVGHVGSFLIHGSPVLCHYVLGAGTVKISQIEF